MTVELTPITGGVCLGHLGDDDHCVDVLSMIYNYRITETRRRAGEPHDVYGRAWCFSGTSATDFQRTIAAALTWGGDADSEPVGWIKRVHETTTSYETVDVP